MLVAMSSLCWSQGIVSSLRKGYISTLPPLSWCADDRHEGWPWPLERCMSWSVLGVCPLFCQVPSWFTLPWGLVWELWHTKLCLSLWGVTEFWEVPKEKAFETVFRAWDPQIFWAGCLIPLSAKIPPTTICSVSSLQKSGSHFTNILPSNFKMPFFLLWHTYTFFSNIRKFWLSFDKAQ